MVSGTMNCTYCNAALPESSRFCTTCGADLSDPEVSTRGRAAVKELFEAIRVAVANRYQVTTMLGRGGMGAVFLAEDLRLGRTVAIKVLRPELAAEGAFIGRFEREARIAARLDHPNIIPIYAVEEVDGLHYFVMKFIAGKSLDELLTGEPLPLDHCLQVLWQTACGLGHAHERGVIHRDVKPSNIMIDESGRAILTDFGISKALQHDTQYTSTGQMIGTPRYISPEQAQGLPVDGRSDQYSLALVGYQMLVGRLPFVADSVHALIYKHIYEIPPSVIAGRPEVPIGMSKAVDRALAKEPGERFPTMEEFATALWPERPVRSGQPTPTIVDLAPLKALMRTPRPSRRRAGILAVIAGALAVAFVLGRRSDRAPPSSEDQRSTPGAVPMRDPPPTPKPTLPSVAPAIPAEVGRTPAAAPETAQGSEDHPSGDSSPRPAPVQPSSTPIRRARPSPSLSTPTPPNPPAATPGYVTINAVPYGTVSMDGVEIGDTPVVRRAVTPGEHVVRITRPGYRTESASVTVTAGNEVRISRALIKDSL